MFSLYTAYLAALITIETGLKVLFDNFISLGANGTFTITDDGAGYTNGTFYNIPTATSGAGTGMTLNLTISGGQITSVEFAKAGSGYVATDTVTPEDPSIGVPGTPAVITIDTYATVARPVDTALEAVADFKTELNAAIGGSTIFTALAADAYAGQTPIQRTESLNQVQVYVDQLEGLVIGELLDDTAGLPGVGCGYPNDLRIQRAATISALYAAFQEEYSSLNP